MLLLAGALGHEIVTGLQAIDKKAVPSVLDWRDDSLITDCPDVDSLHSFRQTYLCRKSDRLGAVIDKNSRNGHRLILFVGSRIWRKYIPVQVGQGSAMFRVGLEKFPLINNPVVTMGGVERFQAKR